MANAVLHMIAGSACWVCRHALHTHMESAHALNNGWHTMHMPRLCAMVHAAHLVCLGAGA